MKKEVFSKRKFIESVKKCGFSQSSIDLALKEWANKCDGLTSDEMFSKYNCITCSSWMIVVDDNSEIDPKLLLFSEGVLLLLLYVYLNKSERIMI